jgi:hypothetical protein
MGPVRSLIEINGSDKTLSSERKILRLVDPNAAAIKWCKIPRVKHPGMVAPFFGAFTFVKIADLPCRANRTQSSNLELFDKVEVLLNPPLPYSVHSGSKGGHTF